MDFVPKHWPNRWERNLDVRKELDSGACGFKSLAGAHSWVEVWHVREVRIAYECFFPFLSFFWSDKALWTDAVEVAPFMLAGNVVHYVQCVKENPQAIVLHTQWM